MSRRNTPNVPVRHCESVEGCFRATQGGKPFCPQHLFENEYAQQISDANDAVVAEAEAAKNKDPEELDVFGVVATEILRLLSLDGQKTVEKIAQALQAELKN